MHFFFITNIYLLKLGGADVDDSYNEYKAEMNGNSLVVKITKSYQLVTNVYDKKEGCAENKLNYCTDGKKVLHILIIIYLGISNKILTYS